MKLILSSKSPRRQHLIKELGFPVEIRIIDVDEDYPEDLAPYDVPEFLSRLKAEPHLNQLSADEVLVTSDTVVLFDNRILGKPKNEEDAYSMLQMLSNNRHTVISGVTLTSENKQLSFSTKTEVFFSEISQEEIKDYIRMFKPFDKAGSYGIQEWIGYISVEKINGCYYNVMGLPLHDLYSNLKKHFSN